jgi:L-ornithine N5-monooxygenase
VTPVDVQDRTTDFSEVLGVGFGPANLALAIALSEAGGGGTARFVERQHGVSWHDGMLIEGTTMQVSFLKDLVTLRNPRSRLTFLNYLHERGRLVDFINAKTFFPLRVEYNDYLGWAAGQLDDMVEYGTEAVAVEPVRDAAGDVVELALTVRSSAGLRRLRTRNLVLGMGSTASLPPGVCAGERVWHSSETLHRVSTLEDGAKRLVVVGSGQSAAEVAAHFHGTYPDAEVYAVMTRFGYSIADDSAFTNQIFDPASMSTFYHASDEVKHALLTYHANTNYSVVDADLIADLYRRTYLERVTDRQRLHIMNTSRAVVRDAGPTSVEVDIVNQANDEVTHVTADAVVFATGYQPVDPLSLLGDLSEHCRLDGAGRPLVTRDFRIATDDVVRCAIYLQGPTEHTHGLSSTLLSNSAVRAGEIAGSIGARMATGDPVGR